jgi:Cu/Zn superoxide dismutase
VDAAAPAGTQLHDKEVWLDVEVDGAGRASTVTVADWVIPEGAARSVVVHAQATDHGSGAAGASLLCTDVPSGSTG